MLCWYEIVPGVYWYVLVVYLVGYLQQNVMFFLFDGRFDPTGYFVRGHATV